MAEVYDTNGERSLGIINVTSFRPRIHDQNDQI